MKFSFLLFAVIISLSALAQNSIVKAYLIKPDEAKKIRRDTLQTLTSLKLTDTSYRIVSFVFAYSIETFAGGDFRTIRNEGSVFNEKILSQTKYRIRPGTTLVIDSIIIANREEKQEMTDRILTNVY